MGNCSRTVSFRFGVIRKSSSSSVLGRRIVMDIAVYMKDGKMHGNYTLRALFKTMTPEEVREHKKLLAEP